MRDAGRLADAERAYADLVAERPNDVDLLLERALAHAWAGDHARAAELLLDALRRAPDSVRVRVELARAYFSLGRVLDAEAKLAELDDARLDAEGARPLRAALTAATTIPTPAAPPLAEAAAEPPPTPLQLALGAREAGDIDVARRLLADALAASPDDVDAWQALADLLEYELADFERARAALLEVTRLRGVEPERELRLARLEIWTERSGDAASRLEALLATLDAASRRGEPTDSSAEASAEDALRALRAEAFALLGDLHRWAGDRLRASSHYVLALGEQPDHPRAQAGLAALDAEISRQIAEIESPWRGARASALADTDDFTRAEAALAWVEVESDGWVWGGAAGRRWLRGVESVGLTGERGGLFVELMGARWWRSGTVRTQLTAAGEHVRTEWDLSMGAAFAHRSLGRSTDVRIEHGPAHPLTHTLQSVTAGLAHDRLSVEHTRSLGERTSLTASVDAARLRVDGVGAVTSSDASTRLQASLTVTRRVAMSVSLGVSAQALGFLDPAPSAAPSAPGGPALRLFWDPRLAASLGPLVQLDHELTPQWKVTGRLAPGLALVDERGTASRQFVPHVGAEGGVTHEGKRVRASLELFFYQGQFDGYRSYGARLTLGTLALPALGGS